MYNGCRRLIVFGKYMGGEVKMKRLILTLLLLLIVFPAHAQKQEYFEPSFDFTKAKSIIIALYHPDNFSDVALGEMRDIYFNVAKEKIYDKLSGNHKIISMQMVRDVEVPRANNMTPEEWDKLVSSDNGKAWDLLTKHIRDNYDLVVTAVPIIYDVGTQYCEGYVYTMPSLNTSTIMFPNGQMATVTSNGQTVHSMPGGNFPTVYVTVRFDVAIAKTSFSPDNKVVWARIDDRARVNRDALQNTKPKDVFKRIVNSFADDFVNTITTRKGSKTSSVPF